MKVISRIFLGIGGVLAIVVPYLNHSRSATGVDFLLGLSCGMLACGLTIQLYVHFKHKKVHTLIEKEI